MAEALVSQPARRVCPCCRTVFAPKPPGAPFAIDHCRSDGSALVLEKDFEQADGDPMLGRVVAGRFTVLAKIGNGAMGSVYRAWQTAIGRYVALKIMRYDRASNDDSRARFEREARALSRLVSQHTVTVFDFGYSEDGSVYLAMEILEGESLGARLRRMRRLPLGMAVQIVREALVSLGEAHEKGIIHRDLKPDNLFLAKIPNLSAGGTTETVKLLDFGIAKVVQEERSIDVLETQAGTVFGTPRYMSPEQAQGKPLDARSDLYSLGVILYQMLTGQAPFDDEEAVVVMAHHIKTVATRPSELAPDAYISPALERVVIRALSKDPDDRPLNAEQFSLALQAAEHAGLAASPLVPASRTGEGMVVGGDPLPVLPPTVARRRKRLLIAAGGGAFLGILVIGLIFGRAVFVERRGGAVVVPAVSSDQTPAPKVSSSEPSSEIIEIDGDSLPADALPIASGKRGDSVGAKARPLSAVSATPRPGTAPKAQPASSGSKYQRFD